MKLRKLYTTFEQENIYRRTLWQKEEMVKVLFTIVRN